MITMAYKRKISVRNVPRSHDEGAEETRDERSIPVRQRRDRGWKHWIVREYARYWYVLGCLFIDAFAFLEAYAFFWGYVAGTVVTSAVIILMFFEYRAYRSLWGKGGRFSGGR